MLLSYLRTGNPFLCSKGGRVRKVKIPGVRIKERYFKRTRRGKTPIKYTARGYASNNKVDEVVIYKDPALKKHPKLERAMMSHERTEIRLRSKGMLEPKAHKIAMSKEPKLIRHKSLKQLWKMLE